MNGVTRKAPPAAARRVRSLRSWTGLTQEKFADLIGYQARSVSKWEQGAPLAPHAQRRLEIFGQLRDRLVARWGRRASQEWLREPQSDLGGRTPIDCLRRGELEDVFRALAQATESASAPVDPNWEAYQMEADELEAQFPGQVAAYADGARVALAKDVVELRAKLPARYRARPLLIHDIGGSTVLLRPRFRVAS